MAGYAVAAILEASVAGLLTTGMPAKKLVTVSLAANALSALVLTVYFAGHRGPLYTNVLGGP